MAVETADDRAIFIGVDDFGVAATYSGGTINGIFDNDLRPYTYAKGGLPITLQAEQTGNFAFHPIKKGCV